MTLFGRPARCGMFACLLALTVAGCGGGGGTGGADDAGGQPAAGADYFPLHAGDRWIYAGANGQKSTVNALGVQSVDGVSAMQVRTLDGSGTTDELYVRAPDGVTIVPPANGDSLTRALGPVQMLRFPLVAGSRWVVVDKTLAVDDADGDGLTDSLSVHGESSVLGFESIDTPAGRFAQSAHLHTVLTQTLRLSRSGRSATLTITSDDWYAPDVGPVRTRLTVSDGSNSETATLDVTGWAVNGRRSESVAPTLISKTPTEASVTGGCCTALTLKFSETMDTAAVAAAFTLTGANGQPVAGTWQWKSGEAEFTFVPAVPWATGTYRASLSAAARDLVGNPLAGPVDWTFVVDATAPGVTPVQPAANATEVPLDTRIVFTLDEDADPATVNAATMLLSDIATSTYVDVSVSISGRTVTMTPQAPLRRGARYRVNVVGVMDTHGNIVNWTAWEFTADPGRFAAPEQLWPPGVPITATAVGDIDGDGRNEVLMATGYNFGGADQFKLLVYRRQNDGTWAPPQRYDTPAGYGGETLSIIVADLDGQGRNAVVLTGGGSIQILRRQSDGTLAVSQTLTSGSNYAVRVADMNGDGRPDLVGRPFMGSAIHVWYQAPDGSFGSPVAIPVDAPGFGDLAVGDINGDGRPDIVVAGIEALPGRSIAVLLQQPDGTFAAPAYSAPPDGAFVEGVAIGDVNGDGRADVVFALPYDSAIGVMLQDAQGQLGPWNAQRAGPSATRVMLADVDGDGRLDAISSSRGGGVPMAVNRQRADGSLGGPETFPVGEGFDSPGELSVGDVNGDGLVDIVYGGTWLRQRAIPAAAPPDPLTATSNRPRAAGFKAAGTWFRR